jgi:hypothetical protein
MRAACPRTRRGQFHFDTPDEFAIVDDASIG